MDNLKIKCPVCGGEEFIAIEKPYREGMDTYIEDYTKYCVCCKCGLVLRFAKGIVERKLREKFLSTEEGKKWQELDSRRTKLQSILAALENDLKKLELESNDDSRTVARDKQIKEEIKNTKQRISNLNKEIDSLTKQMNQLKQ